jgi:5-methyltetrahydropteroyltriglutamate--homocysteine methyltransferase
MRWREEAMKRSDTRILTTHVGRLQRPEAVTEAMEASPSGRPTDTVFGQALKEAVRDVVRWQHDVGVDVVCDGEFGKLSWNSYLNSRLGGHEIVPAAQGSPTARRVSRDRRDFAAFYEELERKGNYYSYRSPGRDTPPGMVWACTGPVTYIGEAALRQDLDNLRAAVNECAVEEAFIPATSAIRPRTNVHYSTEEEYYVAVGEAMRTEYQAIVDAGFLVQIDDPHLPDLWETSENAMSVEDYRRKAMRHVEIVNHSLRGIPEDRIRYHICWGSWHGPHTHDIALADIVDILLTVRAQGYVIEAANARHEHEWQVWRDVKLPDGKILIPGVVSHATNVVEHPDLVAWRIRNFASVVGARNVIAGTDCGLGYRVHPQVAEAKLRSLAEGARRVGAAR